MTEFATDFKSLARRMVEKVSFITLRQLRSEHERRVAEWYEQDPEESALVDFALDSTSVVLAVGAYRGDWVSEIFSRYVCTVHAFEPVPAFAKALRDRFERNPHVVVHPEGLAASSRTDEIFVQGNASSLSATAPRTRAAEALQVHLRAATDAIDAIGIETIDLLMVNIEGAEYEVLDQLLAEGYLARIHNLLIQFHDFIPQADERRRAIRYLLQQSHEETFCVPFVWEGWRARQ